MWGKGKGEKKVPPKKKKKKKKGGRSFPFVLQSLVVLLPSFKPALDWPVTKKKKPLIEAERKRGGGKGRGTVHPFNFPCNSPRSAPVARGGREKKKGDQGEEEKKEKGRKEVPWVIAFLLLFHLLSMLAARHVPLQQEGKSAGEKRERFRLIVFSFLICAVDKCWRRREESSEREKRGGEEDFFVACFLPGRFMAQERRGGKRKESHNGGGGEKEGKVHFSWPPSFLPGMGHHREEEATQ